MSPSDSLCQRGAHVYDAQLAAALHLVAEGDRVGDDDLAQAALVEDIDGVAAEDAVGDDGDDLAGAVIFHRLGGLGQRPAGVGHVVDEDGDLVHDVSDEHHAPDDVGSGALLVDESETPVQAVGDGGGTVKETALALQPSQCFRIIEQVGHLPFGATSIGADDDDILGAPVLTNPAQHTRLGVEIIYGDVEEALDLRSMQVHGDNMVAAGSLQHVRDELGGYGRATLVLLVLPRIREIRDDGGDSPGAGGSAGVDHDEKLHEAIVDVARGSGLEDED